MQSAAASILFCKSPVYRMAESADDYSQPLVLQGILRNVSNAKRFALDIGGSHQSVDVHKQASTMECWIIPLIYLLWNPPLGSLGMDYRFGWQSIVFSRLLPQVSCGICIQFWMNSKEKQTPSCCFTTPRCHWDLYGCKWPPSDLSLCPAQKLSKVLAVQDYDIIFLEAVTK